MKSKLQKAKQNWSVPKKLFLWLFVVPQALATLINQFESPERTDRSIDQTWSQQCVHIEGWTAACNCSDGKKDDCFCSDTTAIFVCCRSLTRSVSLCQLYFNQPKKIKIGRSGVEWCGGVRWGGVRAINYFFEFPTQNVLPQKYAIRSSSSSLAIVNASRTCSDDLLVPKFFFKIRPHFTIQFFWIFL
jgi:hypothetical protein